MGKSHSLHRKTATAASVLIVIGSVFSGVYRMIPVPQKPQSTARRERRENMRKALEAFDPPPALTDADRLEAEIWGGTLADGLHEA